MHRPLVAPDDRRRRFQGRPRTDHVVFRVRFPVDARSTEGQSIAKHITMCVQQGHIKKVLVRDSMSMGHCT